MKRFVYLLAFLSMALPKAVDLDGLEDELYSELYNATMEWGTYKPNQFFAVKNRHKYPVTVGMIWAAPDQARHSFTVRHTYRYLSGDGVTAHYEFHDGWSSARQVIEDPFVNARITVDFAKTVS